MDWAGLVRLALFFLSFFIHIHPYLWMRRKWGRMITCSYVHVYLKSGRGFFFLFLFFCPCGL